MIKMTVDEAHLALKELGLRYAPKPMPWSQGGEQNLEALKVWTGMMCQFPPDAVRAAIDRLVEREPEWPSNMNVFHKEVQACAREQISARARRLALNSATRCDGSGMVHREVGIIPCPTCNPFLHLEWQDGRWNDTGPKRDARWKEWHDRNGDIPPSCEWKPNRDGNDFAPVTGYAIAVEAYEQECREQGRQPSKRKIDQMLRWVENVAP